MIELLAIWGKGFSYQRRTAIRCYKQKCRDNRRISVFRNAPKLVNIAYIYQLFQLAFLHIYYRFFASYRRGVDSWDYSLGNFALHAHPLVDSVELTVQRVNSSTYDTFTVGGLSSSSSSFLL